MEATAFKESLEKWFTLNNKKVKQEGILAHLEDSSKIRACPNCKGKLRINPSNFKVYCKDCGYVEPCHLRSLKISAVNCSSCPYSARFKEDLALKTIKVKYFKSLKHKNQYSKLPLGVVNALVQENLAFPKLKSKCYQAWNPQSIKAINSVKEGKWRGNL